MVLMVGEQTELVSVNREGSQSGASALVSVDGCFGSSPGQQQQRRAVVVAEEGKRDGPETHTYSHFQVPLEGEELGLQKEEARSGPIYPIPFPPIPLAPCLC